jgi:hypothetical protein
MANDHNVNVNLLFTHGLKNCKKRPRLLLCVHKKQQIAASNFSNKDSETFHLGE